MKKIKLISIGNYEEYNDYILEKHESFFDVFGKLFYDVFQISADFHEEYDEEKGDYFIRERNIKNYKDKKEGFIDPKKKVLIDIFYGDKVIFLVVYCSKKLREKFNVELEKVTYMVKPKLKKSIKNETQQH